MKPPTGRTALYELHDAAGNYLYAGVSAEPRTRFQAHAYDKDWWSEVATREITWFDTRAEAEAAEVVAIRTKSPRYNKAIPDENGRYTIGVGRPKWEPDPDHTDLLAQLRQAADAQRIAEGRVWELVKAGKDQRIPARVLVDTSGISRPTLYRKLRITDAEEPR